MPLIKSGSRQAVSTNISEMVHAGHPQNQAVAAALSNARKYGHAAGGVTPTFYEKNAFRAQTHQGFLHSPVPGRTDKLPISVSGGAYVLPADHVAALGQGNSLAGANIVNKMFKLGPYGSQQMPMHAARSQIPHLGNLTPKPPTMSARGGAEGFWFEQKDKLGRIKSKLGQGKPTPIIAAGGEIVIPPENIIQKFGDLKHGHKALDQWVLDTRDEHIKTLRKLRPPKKD